MLFLEVVLCGNNGGLAVDDDWVRPPEALNVLLPLERNADLADRANDPYDAIATSTEY